MYSPRLLVHYVDSYLDIYMSDIITTTIIRLQSEVDGRT